MWRMATHTESERGSPPPKINMGVRIDADLLEALTEDAGRNGRTVAQSIRHHLRQALGMAA
jgi:hypothetical protein